MQRRAAAAYIALFIVIAAGAYAVIATAQPPEESMNADEAVYTLSQGDSLTVNGRTYEVRSVSPESAATLAWTNQSAPYSEVWGSGDEQVSTLTNASVVPVDGGFEITFPATATANYTPPDGINVTGAEVNGTTVTMTLADDSTDVYDPPGDGPVVSTNVTDDGSRVAVEYFEVPVVSYDVLFPEGANDTVLLRQQLPEDLETIDRDDGTFVVLDQDGQEVLVPLEEYEPLDRVRINGSDTLQYRGNVTRISVGNGTATLNWNAPRVNTVEAGHAANTTLNGKQFFGYFTETNAISLFENPSGYEAYRGEVEETQYFNERMNGFWGVVLLSIIAAGFVSALAYLPRKDT